MTLYTFSELRHSLQVQGDKDCHGELAEPWPLRFTRFEITETAEDIIGKLKTYLAALPISNGVYLSFVF